MNVNTKLSVEKYAALVRDIADSYFDANGEYAPHMGKINSMVLFYAYCCDDAELNNKLNSINVDDPDEDNPDEIANVNMMRLNVLADNDEFISEFNNALANVHGVCLDFSNAYIDALRIVETKKSSLDRVITLAKSSIENLLGIASTSLTKENIKSVERIAKDIANGNITPETIAEAYGKSKRFEEVVNASAEAITDDGKIISINGDK